MSGRRNVPSVDRPTGVGRLIELGKDVLILALTCSALFLAAQTPIAAHLKGWVAPSPQTGDTALRGEQTILPYAMAVRGELGLYGVSYDGALVERTFERFSPLFGEALSHPGEQEEITFEQWQKLLESPGVCCVFQGEPPLEVLSAWLGGGEGLSGKAHDLLLAWSEDTLWLGWRRGGEYYRTAVELDYPLLAAALADFRPNGAAWAYTLADDEAYERLSPLVLVSMTAPQPRVYTVSSVDLETDAAARKTLLTALGFATGPEGTYETAEGLAVTEGGDRLQLTSSGLVTFRAGDDTRYPVTRTRSSVRASDAAQAAWDILSRAVEPWMGEGTLVLTSAGETETGWVITFHRRLDGVPVLEAGEGWTARFVIEDGRVSEFTILLRTCSAAGETTVLPTARLAAAALRSLPEEGGELKLCYTDNRGTALTAGWMAGE